MATPGQPTLYRPEYCELADSLVSTDHEREARRGERS